MSLDDVVQLTITAQSQVPTRQGFGTPLILAVHNVTPNTVDTYTKLSEITDAGFALSSPVYRMAQVIFSQNPRPSKVLVGKRLNAYTQTVKLSPLKTTEGYTYRLTAVTPAGVSSAVSYTVPAAATPTTIAAALAPLLDTALGADVSGAAATGVVTLTSAVGKLFNLKDLPDPSILEVEDTTTDPGIVADMTAILTADPLTWYCILPDHISKASATALAGWVETQRKIALVNVVDSGILKSSVSDDVASTLKGAVYARTIPMYSARELLPYSAAGWAALALPKPPGSITWSYKTMAGVSADTLTGGQIAQLKAKRCNYYVNIAGVNVTQTGITPAGEWIDVVHGVDWLYARIQEAIFGRLAQADKIPYTDSGVDQIRAILDAQIKNGIKAGLLAASPAYTITFPKVADVDQADRAARHLPDGAFEAPLAGAIHSVAISGVVKV